jgi:hypothetical protein
MVVAMTMSSSATTIDTTTDNFNEFDNNHSRKRFQCRHCAKSYNRNIIFVFTSKLCIWIRRRCPNGKSTRRSRTCSSLHMRTKAVSVRSMSKALSGARLVGRAQGVAHRGRFGSVLQVVRLVCVSVLQLLLRRPMFTLTFSPITSTISPFKITLKKRIG